MLLYFELGFQELLLLATVLRYLRYDAVHSLYLVALLPSLLQIPVQEGLESKGDILRPCKFIMKGLALLLLDRGQTLGELVHDL